MNYYIDEKKLLLTEQNIFTAIEIKTLLPVRGAATMKDFFEANKWTKQWLPACPAREQEKEDKQFPGLKNILEWLINKTGGERLDDYFMRVTAHRWKRKEQIGKCNAKGQPMELITGKHHAYSNPGAFQQKVLTIYEEKLAAFSLP